MPNAIDHRLTDYNAYKLALQLHGWPWYRVEFSDVTASCIYTCKKHEVGSSHFKLGSIDKYKKRCGYINELRADYENFAQIQVSLTLESKFSICIHPHAK